MDDVIYRRARHVISENARTLAATELLGASNLEGLGVLMAESHQSMRNDFEISVDGIDRLVEILQNAIGKKGGARMTGGGFGGAVLALMRSEEVEQVARIVDARYQTPAGAPPLVMLERASACASIVNRVGP
jgi:galactokinase